MTENTGPDQRPAHWFKPGQSGNPNGRPRGSRNKLQERFVEDLLATWELGGKEALEKVQKDDPSTYVRVVASLLPKEVKLESPLSDLSDDELSRLIDIIRATVPGTDQAGGGARSAPGPDEAPPIPTLQ